MNRRALLSTVAGASVTGLGGCLAPLGLGSGAPSNPVDDDERHISVTAVDSVPDAGDVDIDVRVLDDSITPSETAVIAVETTVLDEARVLPVTQGSCAILNRSACSSDPPGLWLESADEESGTENAAVGWVKRGLPTGRAGFGGYGCQRVEYESGTTIRNIYTVWDDGRVDGYLDPGEYRWAEDVSVRDASSDSGEFRSFEWGFSLELTTVEGE